MNTKKKSLSFFNVFALTFAIATAITILFGLTSSIAYGAERTAETPELFCEYYDEQGNQVDGNHLSSGIYDVDFIVRGFTEISVIQISATYDTSVVTIEGVTDSISSMTSMGNVTANGDLVVGYVADGDSVSVNSEAQFIATVKMSFTFEDDDNDARDYITVAENPHLTFVVTNSAGDNYDAEYALVTTYEGYDDNLLSLMTCDITPELAATTFDVSGHINIAIDTAGTPFAGADGGLVGITVGVKDSDNVIIATAVTDENGEYTLEGVPAGEYTMLISGPSTIDRTVTLVVTESKTVETVGIVMSDYTKDGRTNAADKSVFLGKFSSGTYDVYCDYNADGRVNAADKSAFLAFVGATIQYENVTL